MHCSLYLQFSALGARRPAILICARKVVGAPVDRPDPDLCSGYWVENRSVDPLPNQS